jgi:hypothetical protein
MRDYIYIFASVQKLVIEVMLRLFFPGSFAGQGVLNKDSKVWLHGCRLSPKVLVNNFELNLSFASIKNSQKNAKLLSSQVN